MRGLGLPYWTAQLHSAHCAPDRHCLLQTGLVLWPVSTRATALAVHHLFLGPDLLSGIRVENTLRALGEGSIFLAQRWSPASGTGTTGGGSTESRFTHGSGFGVIKTRVRIPALLFLGSVTVGDSACLSEPQVLCL